jgi:hypothetical protein
MNSTPDVTVDGLRFRRPERVPAAWTDSDETFFRAVSCAFPSDFLFGASVLLESYDATTSALLSATPLGASSRC